MASALQELRKAAGFKNAEDFAREMDIVPSTYKRYEQTPEKIPTSTAWDLADYLETSIDVIVGRDSLDNSAKASLNKFYACLSNDNKKLFDEFSSFLASREKIATEKKKAAEEQAFMRQARLLERSFILSESRKAEDEDLYLLGSSEKLRSAFEKYITLGISKEIQEEAVDEMRIMHESIIADYRLKAAEEDADITDELRASWEEKAKNITKKKSKRIWEEAEERKTYHIKRIMEAYDKLHPEEKGIYEYYAMNLESL